mgnify:CR=1 FL=1
MAQDEPRTAMPNAFNFAASPFDCLTQQQQRLVREHVDIAYFRAGEVILDVGAAPRHLFVLIKGRVSQFDGDECVARYGPDDCFDGRGLVVLPGLVNAHTHSAMILFRGHAEGHSLLTMEGWYNAIREPELAMVAEDIYAVGLERGAPEGRRAFVARLAILLSALSLLLIGGDGGMTAMLAALGLSFAAAGLA